MKTSKHPFKPQFRARIWYVIRPDNQRVGPFSLTELFTSAQCGKLPFTVQICRKKSDGSWREHILSEFYGPYIEYKNAKKPLWIRIFEWIRDMEEDDPRNPFSIARLPFPLNQRNFFIATLGAVLLIVSGAVYVISQTKNQKVVDKELENLKVTAPLISAYQKMRKDLYTQPLGKCKFVTKNWEDLYRHRGNLVSIPLVYVQHVESTCAPCSFYGILLDTTRLVLHSSNSTLWQPWKPHEPVVGICGNIKSVDINSKVVDVEVLSVHTIY